MEPGTENTMQEDNLIDVKAVAKKVGVSVPTIHRWAANGKFPKSTRLGSCARWSARNIDQWVNEKLAAQA